MVEASNVLARIPPSVKTRKPLELRGFRGSSGFYCAGEGIRTPNLLIRSQMLYPLSYARNKTGQKAEVNSSVEMP